MFQYELFPILISPFTPQHMLKEITAEVDGMLLMGGQDIDPKHYSQEKHPKTEIGNPERDVLEFSLIRRFIEERKPILGICRGCQMMAVASGGALHQHVPDLGTGEEHGLGEGVKYDDLVTSHRHMVYLDKESAAFKIAGTDEVMTNTAHHQSVSRVGRDFKIVGKTKGGVVELIEHKDPEYFCFGIQSHPEAVSPSFFENFFAAFSQSL
jgi:putative glutamine amidotransferase